MSYFAEDHYCETLRGFRKLPPSSIVQALAKRCVWLEQRISFNAALGKASDFYVNELASIVALVEAQLDVAAFQRRLEKYRQETHKP